MSRCKFPVILILAFFIGADFSVAGEYLSGPGNFKESQKDTLIESQNLYNGRLWRNLYSQSESDQFLFSSEFLPGSLTINGKRFTDVLLKYDIYNDEILTPVDPGGILQLNKEKVDSFSLLFHDTIYKFKRLQDDSVKRSKSYYNILYQGKTSLYLKHIKKIDKLSINGGNEKFYQLNRIYFMKNNNVYLINSKSDLIKALIDKKELVKVFIKKNGLSVSEKEPGSFIPVIKYYDSISR